MLFKGYIDESYDNDFFVLSCTISREDLWGGFEQEWHRCLTERNTELRLHGRRELSRYHATDCQGKYKEFKGWTTEEQSIFTKKLLGAIKKAPSHSSAYTLILNDLRDTINLEFGVNLSFEELLTVAYTLTLPFCMYSVGKTIAELDPGAKITMFHDQSDNDSTILSIFNNYQSDPEAEFRHMFTTIASLDSRDCLPLQAADFIAYEFFKDRRNEVTQSGRARRKSLRHCLNKGRE